MLRSVFKIPNAKIKYLERPYVVSASHSFVALPNLIGLQLGNATQKWWPSRSTDRLGTSASIVLNSFGVIVFTASSLLASAAVILCLLL
jgi:hypothetical protein